MPELIASFHGSQASVLDVACGTGIYIGRLGGVAGQKVT